MRVLFYGDVQINHTHADYMACLEATLDYLENVIRQLQPDYVVNLGDVLDTNGIVDARDLVFAYRRMRRIGEAIGRDDGPRHIVLLGNHDLGDASSLSAIEVFESNVTTVVLEPKILNGMALFPYTRDLEKVLPWLEATRGHGARLVAAHLDWKGPRLTPTQVSTTGLDVAEYTKRVGLPCFNGHIHTPQVHPPIYFVGSPLYADFSDAESDIPRGFVLYDSETGATSQIVNSNTFRIRQIRAETAEELGRAFGALVQEGLNLGSVKVKVFVPKALMPVADQSRSYFLWMGIYPTDSQVQHIAHKVSISVHSTRQEIVAAAVAVAPAEYNRDLLQKTGEEAFRP